MDYKTAGVDIHKAEKWVDYIKDCLATNNANLLSKVGDYAGIYKINDRTAIAATTDGVGTKIKLAMDAGLHSGIGQDLVAMNVNDLLCVGATPLFFLDYIAHGKIDDAVKKEIFVSIVEACSEARMLLLGGETAQMSDFYDSGKYDLAGFAVGLVHPDKIITGKKIKPGDIILGIPSTGAHSNGYTLIRKLFDTKEKDYIQKLLAPTRIYVKEILNIINSLHEKVHGIAHVTGSGFRNLFRLTQYGFDITLPQVPEIFQEIKKRANIDYTTMFETFNMGWGMLVIVEEGTVLNKEFSVIGTIQKSSDIHINLGKEKIMIAR